MEAPGGRRLTVTEVGRLLGTSERSAREWVKRHSLPQTESRPVRVAEREVLDHMIREGRIPRRLSEALGGVSGGTAEDFGGRAEVPGAASEPIEAAYQVAGDAAPMALVPLATMVEELRGLADQLADLARRNEGLALEIGQLRERGVGHEARLAAKDAALGAKDETIAELRRRAEAAERERDESRAQASPAPPSEAPTILVMTEPPEAQRPAETFWQRVRRAFGGV